MTQNSVETTKKPKPPVAVELALGNLLISALKQRAQETGTSFEDQVCFHAKEGQASFQIRTLDENAAKLYAEVLAKLKSFEGEGVSTVSVEVPFLTHVRYRFEADQSKVSLISLMEACIAYSFVGLPEEA